MREGETGADDSSWVCVFGKSFTCVAFLLFIFCLVLVVRRNDLLNKLMPDHVPVGKIYESYAFDALEDLRVETVDQVGLDIQVQHHLAHAAQLVHVRAQSLVQVRLAGEAVADLGEPNRPEA